ncbi:hypothetical protein F4861DRAFT_132871 [Xylaria intraflava]|nr:hypothetical protein F4861DRAFT_132871 [Xylaria intraflava]
MGINQAPPSFYILPPARLLPASTLSTWLGRIVRSYSEPDANFVPVDPTPFVTHPFATSVITNASLSTLSQQHKSLAATLGVSAIHASRETGNGDGLSFSSSEVVCVRLQDYDGVFDRLTNHAETRTQLGRMLARGDNAGYMVTGVLIWRDATFTYSRQSGIETSAGVTVPASAIVAGMTGIMLPSDLTDPGISGSRGRHNTVEVSGESIGSHIFAVQYKIVRRYVIQSWLGMRNSIRLRRRVQEVIVSPSNALPCRLSMPFHDGDDELDYHEDDHENHGVRGDKRSEDFNSQDEAETDVDVMEMDEDDLTWADMLVDDVGAEMERADIMFDGEAIQFAFDSGGKTAESADV